MRNLNYLIYAVLLCFVSNFLKAQYPTIKLAAKAQNSYLTDETNIMFRPGASNYFDPDYDTYKMFSLSQDLPYIYQLSYENDPPDTLSINTMPPVTINNIDIEIGIFVRQAGDYTLRLKQLSGFDAETQISIEDLYTSVIMDLRNFPDYNFEITEGNENIIRFAVHITPGNCSFSMGKEAKNSAINTGAIGCFSNAAAENSIALGHNVKNKQTNSIALGMNDSVPVMTINNGGDIGRVGIGTIRPNSKLEIWGDVEDVDYAQELMSLSKALSSGINFRSSLFTIYNRKSLWTSDNELQQANQMLQGLKIGGDDPAGLSINSIFNVYYNGNMHSGINAFATGDKAFAIGSGETAGARALGISSIAIGSEFSSGDQMLKGLSSNIHGALASGINSIAIGSQTTSDGFNSVALGAKATSTGSNSLALGYKTSALAENSSVIGSGNDEGELVNDIPNSVAIGSNSTEPAVWIKNGGKYNSQVGIGTSNPMYAFHIKQPVPSILLQPYRDENTGIVPEYYGIHFMSDQANKPFANIVLSNDTGKFVIVSSGNKSITINKEGKVGINQYNPEYNLDVYGETRLKGGINIGSTDSNVAGTIRWNGTNFQGYNGTEWKIFDGAEGVTGPTGLQVLLDQQVLKENKAFRE